MKKILISLLAILFLLSSFLILTDRAYLFTAVRTIWLRGQVDAGVHDYSVLPTRLIKAGTPQPWKQSPYYNTFPLSDKSLENHAEYKSTAFLVIHQGELLAEHYFNGGSPEYQQSIWSVSKTFTSMAALKAVEDGLFSSINAPVKNYIPNWPVVQKETLTLRHLASMSAGLYWDELDHSPFSLIAKFTFHPDIVPRTIHELPAIGVPGELQHYNSGGTQLLGSALFNVLGQQTFSDYLSEKFWRPLGMQQDGLFVLDSQEKGKERVFGGMVASARDIAKLGQLILNEGIWEGQQLISKEHINLIKTLPYKNKTYAYGLWTGDYAGSPFYSMQGFRGQYVIVVPEHELVIARLGYEMMFKNDLEAIQPHIPILIEEAVRIKTLSQQ